MCPLTRLVHSLNDCFDDRTHWYTLSLSYHQIFLTEQKNNTKNWQQQSNDQISKVFFISKKQKNRQVHSFRPIQLIAATFSHTLSSEKKKENQKFSSDYSV